MIKGEADYTIQLTLDDLRNAKTAHQPLEPSSAPNHQAALFSFKATPQYGAAASYETTVGFESAVSFTTAPSKNAAHSSGAHPGLGDTRGYGNSFSFGDLSISGPSGLRRPNITNPRVGSPSQTRGHYLSIPSSIGDPNYGYTNYEDPNPGYPNYEDVTQGDLNFGNAVSFSGPARFSAPISYSTFPGSRMMGLAEPRGGSLTQKTSDMGMGTNLETPLQHPASVEEQLLLLPLADDQLQLAQSATVSGSLSKVTPRSDPTLKQRAAFPILSEWFKPHSKVSDANKPANLARPTSQPQSAQQAAALQGSDNGDTLSHNGKFLKKRALGTTATTTPSGVHSPGAGSNKRRKTSQVDVSMPVGGHKPTPTGYLPQEPIDIGQPSYVNEAPVPTLPLSAKGMDGETYRQVETMYYKHMFAPIHEGLPSVAQEAFELVQPGIGTAEPAWLTGTTRVSKKTTPQVGQVPKTTSRSTGKKTTRKNTGSSMAAIAPKPQPQPSPAQDTRGTQQPSLAEKGTATVKSPLAKIPDTPSADRDDFSDIKGLSSAGLPPVKDGFELDHNSLQLQRIVACTRVLNLDTGSDLNGVQPWAIWAIRQYHDTGIHPEMWLEKFFLNHIDKKALRDFGEEAGGMKIDYVLRAQLLALADTTVSRVAADLLRFGEAQVKVSQNKEWCLKHRKSIAICAPRRIITSNPDSPHVADEPATDKATAYPLEPLLGASTGTSQSPDPLLEASTGTSQGNSTPAVSQSAPQASAGHKLPEPIVLNPRDLSVATRTRSRRPRAGAPSEASAATKPKRGPSETGTPKPKRGRRPKSDNSTSAQTSAQISEQNDSDSSLKPRKRRARRK